MLVPRPISARQIVRRNISQIIADTGELYATILGGVEDEAVSGDEPDEKALIASYRTRLLKIWAAMETVQQQMSFAR